MSVRLPRRVRPTAPAASPAVAGYHPLVLAVAVAWCFASPNLRAQATGGQAIHGSVNVSQQGNTQVITTQNGAGSRHSAVNWQSFSVQAGQAIRVDQPSTGSTSINRVVGNNPSQIFGTLSSNGRLVLVNPSGIAVGAGAVVDTAGFTASTLALSEADAIAGRLRFANDGSAGALGVQGTIVARSGDVVLIAPKVETAASAVIQSPNGATILAAGQKVEITGRGLEGIHLEVQAPSDRVVNLGTLSGDAVGIFAGTLKHSGLIRADQVTAVGGKVLLQASGDALVSGRIEAAAAGGKGGSIDVFGERVGLQAGASLQASGAQGGGSIRVGGDFQGKNAAVKNAQRTYVDKDATLRADATDNGDGGRIIVWADEQTQSHGAISARGGAQGGDGGFVEVSGKHRLNFSSPVDTRAPQGRTGTLLLDPDNITVAATGTDYADTPVMFADTPADLTLDVGTINSATTNVELQANEDILIDTGANINIAAAGVGFTARAGGFLTVQSGITTNGGDITLSAGDAGSLTGPNEGALYVAAPLNSNGGAITLKSTLSDVGGTSLSINAAVNAGTGVVDIEGQSIDLNASVTRSGPGDLTLTADRIEVLGSLGSAGGRVVFRTVTLDHAVTLGGIDEGAALNLTQAELSSVIADTVVVGWGDRSGGITVEGAINLAPANVTALSLLNDGALGTVAQTAALSVSKLNVDAAAVNLTNAGNQVGEISGRSHADAFAFSNSGALVVGAVDGVAGISSGPHATILNTSGALTQTAPIVAQSLIASASGGMILGHAGNQVASFGSLSNSGSGNLILRNGLASTFTGGISTPGAVDIAITGGGATFTSTGSVFGNGVTIKALDPAANLDLQASVNAGSGALVLEAGGDILFNSSGSMGLAGGSASLTVGADRKVIQAQGFTIINVALDLVNFEFLGGYVDGSGNLTVASCFDWQAGSLLGSGSLVLNGVAGITGAVMAGRAITNNGSLTLSAAGDVGFGTGAAVTNNGIIEIQNNGGFSGPATIANNGLFKKTGGGGVSNIAASMGNGPGGAIVVKDGTLQFSAGMFTSNDGVIDVALAGTSLVTGNTALLNSSSGVIMGSGSLDLGTATLTNNGKLQPGGAGAVGVLTIRAASVSHGATATIEADLLDAANYDQVNHTGVVALATGVQVAANNMAAANYAKGAVFDVVRGTSVSGPAPTVTGFTSAIVAGSPAALRLTSLATVPPPPPPSPPPAPKPPAPKPPTPAPAKDAAVQEPLNQVVAFAELFVKAAEEQKKDGDRAQGEAAVTNEVQCKR